MDELFSDKWTVVLSIVVVPSREKIPPERRDLKEQLYRVHEESSKRSSQILKFSLHLCGSTHESCSAT